MFAYIICQDTLLIQGHPLFDLGLVTDHRLSDRHVTGNVNIIPDVGMVQGHIVTWSRKNIYVVFSRNLHNSSSPDTLLRELTNGAVVANDAVGDAAVGTYASVAAYKNVFHHLAAVTQADPGSPVDVVARVGAAASLLVREVGLRGKGVKPSTHEVRRHGIVHEQVGNSDAVAVLGDVHVNLIAEDL